MAERIVKLKGSCEICTKEAPFTSIITQKQNDRIMSTQIPTCQICHNVIAFSNINPINNSALQANVIEYNPVNNTKSTQNTIIDNNSQLEYSTIDSIRLANKILKSNTLDLSTIWEAHILDPYTPTFKILLMGLIQPKHRKSI